MPAPNYRDYYVERGEWGWTWAHEDYDGAPDSHDKRCGVAETQQECFDAIDELEEELADG